MMKLLSLGLLASVLAAADAACPVTGQEKGEGPCPHDLASPPMGRTLEETNMGCKCTSKCSATVTEGKYKCDWCWTESGCGQSSIRGNWDYCVYPLMDEFEAQYHTEKMTQIWGDITAPDVIGKNTPAYSLAKAIGIVITESVVTTFDNHREVMPKGRVKPIHVQGVNCKVQLTVEPNSPFTGVLGPGNQSGLIRMGSAATLDDPLPSPLPPFFPGFGIKFLRTGVRSADWVGLRAEGPGGTWDFFGDLFSNHVSPAGALVKTGKFQQASGCISMVGLSDACTYDQDGTHVTKPVFPFELLFRSNLAGVHFPDKKTSNAGLVKELEGIPVGSKLFDVSAYESPEDKIKGFATPVGTLTTTSECHASLFGDLSLFFRHQRMEEDLAQAPEWIPQMLANPKISPACTPTTGPVSKWQCQSPSSEQTAFASVLQKVVGLAH